MLLWVIINSHKTFISFLNEIFVFFCLFNIVKCTQVLLSITVSQSAHSGHDAENVVVNSVDAEILSVSAIEGKREGSIVDTGHIDSAGGLMLLGVEGKGVNVDTAASASRSLSGDTGVVLVGLDKIEVRASALGEAVVTIEEKLGSNDGVNIIRIVRVITETSSSNGGNPDELLDGVVEVEADLGGRARNGLITSELELLDEVLVGGLGETTTLLSVEVDVVDVELSLIHGINCTTRGNNKISFSAEGKVDLNLVVLEGDEGKGKTGVAAEPELERDIEGLLSVIVRTSSANHLVITSLLLLGDGKLVPDLHPVSVVLIDLLTTDLKLDILDKEVTETSTSSSVGTEINGGLEVDTVDEITVAGDSAGDTVAEVRRAVEGLLDSLNGEVGVPAIDNLEEGNLGITSKIDILSAVSDELH